MSDHQPAHLEHSRGHSAHHSVPAHGRLSHGSHRWRDVDVEALGQHDEAGQVPGQQLGQEGLHAAAALHASSRQFYIYRRATKPLVELTEPAAQS